MVRSGGQANQCINQSKVQVQVQFQALEKIKNKTQTQKQNRLFKSSSARSTIKQLHD
jgi:hypothetical protein